ncbi:MFS transporter [Streptosporangium algeriense]|uniref:MFS transporter n=1 Tax=Streptosporangium algeriense TaxID=1682748 RepID=A0ABW3DQU9_9ACTN
MTAPGHAPVRRLWGAVLFGYLALGATLQELPGYVVEKYDGGPSVVGLVVGIAFAGTALGRPFAGRAGDAGHARAMAMTGGMITALSAAGQLIAPNVTFLTVCRLLMGLGEAALFSGSLPWVIKGVAADRRGRVAGWFGLSMWGGLSIGPLITVLLRQVGDSTAVWSVIILLPLLSTVLIATTRRQDPSPASGTLRPSSWRDIVPRGVSLPGLCLGLAAYGYGSLTALLVLYLSHERIGGQNVGLVFFAVAFLVTRGVGSPLADRYGGIMVARVVLFIEALGLYILAEATTQPVALLGTAVTGIGLGLIYPSTSAITLSRTGPLQAGVSMGTMTSFWDLGIMAAGPVSGLAADHFGYRSSFLIAVGVTAVAIVLTLVGLRSPRPVPACAGSSQSSGGRGV